MKGYSKSKYVRNTKKTDPRMTDEYVFFHHSWPSQWHKAPMTIDNVRYNCCEQYMMAQKAKLFKDENTHRRIMDSPDPGQQKALGRRVRNFSQKTWDKHRKQIVFDANYAKFTQNKKLKEKLLSCGQRVFVEASRSDRIWGIGLAVMDPKADNPGNWRGLNLLGSAISSVRDALLSQSGPFEEEKELKVGSLCTLHGLKGMATKRMNGKLCKIAGPLNEDEQRYPVLVLETHDVALLKRCNLRVTERDTVFIKEILVYPIKGCKGISVSNSN